MLALLLGSSPTSIAQSKEVSLKDMWSICSPGEWHNEGGDVGKLDPDIRIRGAVCGLTSYTNDICDIGVVGGVRSSALVVSSQKLLNMGEGEQESWM